MNSLSNQCTEVIEQLIKQHQLPSDSLSTLVPYYAQVAQWISSKKTRDKTLIISINGSQGSGKSTLTEFVKAILSLEYSFNAVFVSIDDFYCKRQDRLKLAETIHPLFTTRGVPGTHDLQLACDTLDSLSNLGASNTLIPKFDKKMDDQSPKEFWKSVKGPVDIILFEGWCNHAPIQHESELIVPINELEKTEDSDGTWRRYVNDQLKNYHQQLFNKADYLVFLQVPSFEKVFEWRGLQEQKLRNSINTSNQDSKVMDEHQLARFIHHYERITRACLNKLPNKADCVIKLDENHAITQIHFKPTMTQWVVFSDMDGTILNHHTYDYDASLEMVDQLNRLSIPLIFNTSKTFAELEQWLAVFKLSQPFIVENGSAIYVPKGYFSSNIKLLQNKSENYDIIPLGVDIQELETFVRKLAPNAISLTRCSLQEAMAITGLNEEDAAKAQQREFSIPLKFELDQEQKAFVKVAQDAGYYCIEGGRFLHFMGKTDKARAMLVFCQLITQQQNSPCSSVALGDSPNDHLMLEAADFSIIVNSPNSERLQFKHADLYRTQQVAPHGWSEGLNAFFQQHPH